MEKKTYPLYYGDKLMPWAKGTVVKGAKGFVFLSGTEGTDPEAPHIELADEVGKHVVPSVDGAEAQTRLALDKIKSRLEEMGSSLDNIIKMICYVVGPDFPDGVGNHPTWLTARKVMNEFFKKHCPDLCWDKGPPTLDLIGISGLGAKEMLIEIAVTAVLPDS